MIEAQELTGYISQDEVLTGQLSKTIEVLKPITQEKEVTPTKETQIVEPDKDYTGLSKVTVEPIPSEYIVPNGEVEFTKNGIYDVTDKASAKVNVPEKKFGTKTITSNGTYKASDDNLDGYSEVIADVQIDIDIKQYMIESDLEFKYSTRMDFPIKLENYTEKQVNRVKELINILGGTNNG